MAGGRRNINRSSSQRQQSYFASDDGNKSKFGSLDGLSKTTSPKHMPIPTLPQENYVIFEMIMFVFSATGACLQFLHIYRTIWWLPKSYTYFSVSFYLIDMYLLGFIITILSRRFAYGLLRKIILAYTPSHIIPLIEQVLRLVLLLILMAILVWCTSQMMKTQPIVNIFYLCYPLSVYFILFGIRITPFFDVRSLSSDTDDDSKAKSVGNPIHNCFNSPQYIREEVDKLKNDFNNRMKQVLFSSMMNAYYAGFVPCTFAQKYLYYDVFWATQHLTFVWIGGLTMYVVQCYPIKYCDILHRAALHLGKWCKVEGRNCHLPSHMWTDTTLWQQGALVKHSRELYKAEGVSNAAEPGNLSHIRFYGIFSNPSVFLCLFLGFQLSLVLLQLIILIRTTEWYQIISLSLLLFANYYTLFKLARDYLICGKIYKVEAMFYDKNNS